MIIDGNDVIKVYEATKIAVERARAGEGPTVIEALTYRHYGHSRSDPAKYRPADEVERWMQRDPLLVARQRLIEPGSRCRRYRHDRRQSGASDQRGRPRGQGRAVP